MNYISSMLPVLLPIALFVVTLIIIFTLRASDKRSKSLSNVKKLLDIYKGNIEAADNSFKQYATELEQTVSKKDAEVKSLIQTVNTQLAELKSYSEDLVRLKSAMETYRSALEGLARLTSDADDKVQTVQNEVDRLDKVRAVIDGFRQDMKDADEHLRKHEQRVIQLERESIGRMNEAVSETDNSMDEAMAGLHKESDEVLENFKAQTSSDTDLRLRKLDDAFQAVIHTVQQFFGELETKIDEARGIANRLEGVSSQVAMTEPQTETSDDVPKMVVPDMEMGSTLNPEPAQSAASGLASLKVQPQKPEPASVEMPKFKAPKFTPKTDEEYENVEDADDFTPEVENTYGDGINENDDFATFGGVEESSDLRGMDIMDMDYDSFNDSRNASTNRWTKKDGDNKRDDQWETYGEEEVVDFDDDSPTEG